MKKIFDVIISGAGPSGSLLGYLLSEKNISTLVLEKEFFPRYKVCAGGIQWKALELFPYDINEIIEKKIFGVYFARRLKDIFYKKYSKPLIFTFDRPKLDDFMAKKAADAGCNINFAEKIKDFRIEKDGVKVFTDKNIYFSKILVGADGAGSIVSKKLSTDESLQKIIGYEIERPIPAQNNYQINDESIILDFGGIKKGYIWIFPKKQVFSIGGGGPVNDALNIKKYLSWFLRNYPDALKSFSNSQKHGLPDKKINLKAAGENNPVNTSFEPVENDFRLHANNKLRAHFIPVRSEKTFLCDYRVLTIGDAAGLGDGFTGEGIYNALSSSVIAFQSINNALLDFNFSFSDYYEKIHKDIYTNIRDSLLISKIFFSSPYFYYKLIKNNDNIFDSCAKILRGEKKYSDVVNKLKLIKI
ncbi:MAG: FAD-dependent monooxygenase [Candidatus Humimicrobiaceae bacterium]